MKSLTRLFTLCGVVVALVCLSGVLVVADPGGGATVATELGCVITSADWSGSFALFTTDSHSVITPSGNSKLTCHFVIPDGEAPDRAMRFQGFDCGTPGGLTTNTWSVSSTQKDDVLGTVTLQCQIKK